MIVPAQFRGCSGGCSDEEVVLVGPSWDNNDERKMMDTYSEGRTMFGRFADVYMITAELGFQKRGLAVLAAEVLDVTLKKPRGARLYCCRFVLLSSRIFRCPNAADPYSWLAWSSHCQIIAHQCRLLTLFHRVSW
jgi:prepilin signal peptidase PulO-like enzyme (type II secretory pathway)